MKKAKSLDGYYLYQIQKDDVEYYLANDIDYKKDIKNLIDNLDDLKFDSLIIIFGLDTGEYLKELEDTVCSNNKVIIFEPNEDIFNKNKDTILSENMSIVLFDEETIASIIASIIGGDNFDNLYVHAFGNYEKVYKDEYKKLIEIIDAKYYSVSGNITLAYRCKESFMRNSLQNLKVIKESSPLNSYIECNKNVPAIIVSAGPSLDKNIKDMVKNKDRLEKCFVIASNRTFTTLIKNGIKPDLVVSIDPSDAMYEMMKESLNEDAPLLYYEYSNRYLVNEYKGEKIYISNIFSRIIEEMHKFGGLSQGGSVAHTCLAMATLLGCNPIILVGQDLAYTYNKHHSDKATFNSVDKVINSNWANEIVDDVYGKKVRTTTTLKVFKNSMEHHIKQYKDLKGVKFINVSYGADIEGAPHKELDNVLNEDIFKGKKNKLEPDKCIELDPDKIINSIIDFVDEYIEKADKCIDICTMLANIKEDKSLVEIDLEDDDFQKFLFILDIVQSFESSLESFYLGGYFNKFLYAIKRESFLMLAKDYDRLTSNMKYQSKAFLNYFTKMKEMLLETKKIIDEEVSKLK
ncbi:6-hydroxymethylpterin diphosphokinase MptE-like protein [Clostridium sp. ZS1]|uniref:motility associated factor glycosyltransferase family protein n=1 Tax=Clostridium sp. ZS1 TaxID=2949989 RepID=UPI00207929B3|nr:6-hydroxymethylpterin diphosphokinase MptE-like protein [Clostridium sp. ZS1]